MPGEYSQATLAAHLDATNDRLRKIEAQLALLSGKVGVPYEEPSAGVPADVVALAEAGDQMGAIKRYRELTGAGFEDARDIVIAL
jgi:ribosomal protein L7/L12